MMEEKAAGKEMVEQNEHSIGRDVKKPGLTKESKRLLAIVLAVAIISTSALGYMYLSTPSQEGEDNIDEEHILTLVGRSGTIYNVTQGQLETFANLSGEAKAQNFFGNWRGHGVYNGATLVSLVGHSGGMVPGDIVSVIADGYHQNFTYYNIYPDEDWTEIQGEYILAYTFNSTGPGGWEDYPKLVCLPEDGKFSNEDANWTSAVGMGYDTSGSAAAAWVRNVERIEVIAGDGDWNITLQGEQTKVLSGTEYEMFKKWYPNHFVDDRGRNWSGASLSNILGLVDHGDRRGDDARNPMYIPVDGSQGHDIKVVASDGFTRIFEGVQADLFLADAMNGTPLSEGQGPLRLIVPDMRPGNWVGQVNTISLEPKWDLNIVGWDHENWEYKNRTVRYSDLVDMASQAGTAYAYKVSYPDLPIVGPFNYTGISLMSFVEVVWNISYDFTLEVEAEDGYIVTLNSSETAGNITIYDMDKNNLGVQHSHAILAYDLEGESWFNGGPLRLVFINDTGVVTDMGLWNKAVKTLRVLEKVDEWEISIVMNKTGQAHQSVTFSRSEFEHAFYKAHGGSLILEEDNYQGVPIWILLGAVDGNDTYDGNDFYHWGFNDSFATEGYNITVFAGDGYNRTFTSQQAARNDSLLVAHMLNGARLSGSSWPLRLVGPTLSGGERVRNIVSIEIVDAT